MTYGGPYGPNHMLEDIALEEHNLSDGTKRVSLVSAATIFAVVNSGAGGGLTTLAPNQYIGLQSAPTIFAVVNTAAAGQASVALDNSVAKIGFATVSVSNVIGVNLQSQANYIGLASVNIGGSLPALSAGANFIGLTTVVQASSVRSLLGNTTVLSQNVGTNKTLIQLPIALSTTSVATIAVPTNANTIKITNLILSANATVQIRFKSGATYLTGNASIGISLNPNGGFVFTGSPDSPSWLGLPSGAFVIEKNDTTTSIGGSLVYFQE